jgi:hypothetical protein
MRGRKGRVGSPGAVISTAMFMGLAALVRIIQNRSSKNTRRYVKSIEKMWNAAKDALEQESEEAKIGFSPIQAAEPNMRGQFFKFVATTLRRFGNRELKRIYNWMEGAVGPLNELLNYAGARLRELAMFCYPFPRPQAFQIREYPDGSTIVLSKEQADSIGDDGATKSYWRYGYERRGKAPRVFLTHPTMPGMDFVDMIRAHCVELCRQCFIYQVPVTEAHRYIRLLIYHLRPFLDWVYTDGEEGRKGFNRYADYELRKIVLEVRTLYTKRSSRRTRISKRHTRSPLNISLETIREGVSSQLINASGTFERERLEAFLDYLNEGTGVLQERDIEKLADQVLALSEREGNKWHRVLFSGLRHPSSLRQVVFAGDTLLDDMSPLMIVAELPVGNYAGKADLTIFIRRTVDGKTRWTPVMVLEVKTKTAFDFNLYGIRLKRKRNCSIVPALYAWKRGMSEEEWEDILGSGSDSDALAQLGAYEHEIVTEYRELVPEDRDPPSSLWKGVIALDTSESPSNLYPAFQYLLEDLKAGLIQHIADTKAAISVIPEYAYSDQDAPKVVLFIEPFSGPVRFLQDVEPPKCLQEEDPFVEREPDDRTLTLYVSVPSPTSAGVTGARLARDWHLLHHLDECCKISQEPIEVVWLDLLGDYKSDALVQKRMRLNLLRSEKRITENTHLRLAKLLQKIRFVNLSPNCADIISDGERGMDDLFAALRAVFPANRNNERIIILDGWTGLRDMMPAHRQPLLRAIKQRLLDFLPQAKANIIWIDDGVSHTRTNINYQRQCITPLRYDSPRRTHLDEIIYNLPTPPRRF